MTDDTKTEARNSRDPTMTTEVFHLLEQSVRIYHMRRVLPREDARVLKKIRNLLAVTEYDINPDNECAAEAAE